MTTSTSHCPICQSDNKSNLLSLRKFPVYQHPLPSDITVPEPLEVDLNYFLCSDCGHGYQAKYNRDVLENLYKQHYYTPRPPHIGRQFTLDFASFFEKCLSKQEYHVLEIGCSAGEVLSELKSRMPKLTFAGIEPNEETRLSAQRLGFEVYDTFFSSAFADRLDQKFDVIFSRHVIEHVFDFDDFILASSKVLTPNGRMFIETPDLDWAIDHESRMPFHVEHISLFSKCSLSTLLERHGWYIQSHTTSDVGNLIVFCTKNQKDALKFQTPSHPSRLQESINQNQHVLTNLIKDKRVVMWGAGSGGRTLMSFLEFNPELILDGNTNKSDRYFAGLENCQIVSATDWLRSNVDQSENWVMIIASSFYREIEAELEAHGWQGEVISPYKS